MNKLGIRGIQICAVLAIAGAMVFSLSCAKKEEPKAEEKAEEKKE